ncbi:MAG: ChaN family lipoprotein, partial [Myxococcales bacterium]|nr:ChaN family lipoprotein [Myxococcales bacterium]
MRTAAPLLLVALLAACGAAPTAAVAPPYGEWISARGAHHPLAGRIWAVADGAWIEPAALVQRLRQAPFVFLGEKHDNPDHHRLQAWIIGELFAGGRHGAVAFEMLDEDDVAPLAALDRPTATDVARAVDWARSGWPPFAIYRPVFEAALAAGARLVAAHPSRDTLRVAMTEGVDGWPATRRARLGLDRPLPPEAQAALRQRIIETHCGHAPAHIIEPMALAQRVKDGWMASRLL